MRTACKEAVAMAFHRQLGRDLMAADEKYLKEYPGTQLAFEFPWPEPLAGNDQQELVEAIHVGNGAVCRVAFLEYRNVEEGPSRYMYNAEVALNGTKGKGKTP
jgi:hypothetical protein